jgi:hypothetical protein
MIFTIPVTVDVSPVQVRQWHDLVDLTPAELRECLVRCILRGARREIPLDYGTVDADAAVSVIDSTDALIALQAALEETAAWCETTTRYADLERPLRVLIEKITEQI